MANRVVKVTLAAEIAQYKAAMTEAANKTAAVGSETEKLAQKREAFQKLGAGMIVVGGAMTALTLSVMKTGIEYNSLQQTSRAALSTILGGAEAANAQMDKLDEFARTSPFSKSTFITAQQQMLAFGVESKKVIPYLDAIQDAVAAAGGSSQQLSEVAFVMAQISAAGKITGQDLIQFGQRGINAAELIGSQMGKTGAQIRDDITAGTLGADDALDALAGGMKEKFDGAAASVKDTFAGAMDRVQAAWRDLSADLTKPLVDPSGGGALVDFMNRTADLMRAIQALPEPIKLAGGQLFAFAGIVTLASGILLAGIPKYYATKAAFQALSGTMKGIAVAGGIAVLALTAVVAVVGAVAAAQADARARAEAYASTLEEGSNRITKATREAVKEQLALDRTLLFMNYGSAYDNAEKLGISYDLVTEAALGNAEALKELDARLKAGADGSQGYADAAYEISDAVKGEAASVEEAIHMAEQKQSADKESEGTALDVADAYTSEADAASELVDQMTELIGKINEANGVGQDAITANANYQSALAGLAEQVEKNGNSLDEATEAGSANAASLAEVASKAQAAAVAQLEHDKATMSSKDAADKYYGTLQAQRQAFIDSATAAGFNADEVNALANEVFALPSKKDIEVVANTDTAEDKLRRLRDTLSSIPGYRSVTLETIEIGNRTVTANYQGGMYASGVKHFAAGGMLGSGIYAGVMGGIRDRDRVFAEKDMGVPWETYISGRAQDRDRNIGIWQQTGQMLGVGQSQAQASQASSLDGLSITGTFEIGGDGLGRIIDGRITQHDAQAERITRARMRS
ncbi:tape measure protein [Microbacterium sp. A204]|uniref:tape measure protein n=1 Tax=Microbacterium sp. A204 TaxID=3457321 RepID=UPI003FD61EA1